MAERVNLDELKRREEELLEADKRSQAQVQRNSFFEPFDSNKYADKRTGNPVGSSKLTSAGRVLLGSSRARRKKT